MKRDATGKFVRNWYLETKQRISISLTNTAWRSLDEAARFQGISRSEVIERLARGLQANTQHGFSSLSSPLSLDEYSPEIALETETSPISPPLHSPSAGSPQLQLESLLETVSDAIAQFDSQLRYRYVNRALEQILDLSRQALLGKAIAELPLSDEVKSFWQQQIAQVFATAQPHEVETEFATSLGVRFYHTRLVPELDSQATVISVVVVSRDITATRQAERDRTQSQADQAAAQKVTVILESISDAFVAIDRDWRYAYVNRAATQILHQSSQELLGKHVWTEVFPGEVDRVSYQELHRAVAEQTPTSWQEYSHSLQRWLEVNAYPSPEGVAVYFRDITERKQAEADREQLLHALEVERSNFEAVLRQMPAGVMIADAESGRLILANEQAEQMIGYSYQQLLEQQLLDLADPDRPTAYISLRSLDPTYNHDEMPLARSLKTGEIVTNVEMELQREDGSQIILGINSAPILNHQGQIVSAVMVFQDITDRKRIEDEQNQADALLRRSADRSKRLQRVTAALAEASTPKQVAKAVVEHGIAALGGKAGAVVLVSEKRDYLVPFEMVGYPQLVMQQWSHFPITAPIALAETVRTGNPIFLENPTEILHHFPEMADVMAMTESQAIATIPLIVSGRTLGGMSISFAEPQRFNENDRTFILTLAQQCAQAIARAQLYEAEQRARASAEAANRAKDEFLAMLSHELRTPLNPILGWTQLLLKDKLHGEAIGIALKTIERNAKLQVQLIEDLLDISRILQGKLSLNSVPVNLALTIEAAIETIRLAAEAKAIRLQTHFAPTPCMVLGDNGRLQQVLWNLLSNAVKFTPSQGHIQIRLACIGQTVSIQVQDNGKGIQPEFLPHIFEYFRQADSSITRTFGGLGLGLAIARHIVELHGGIIQAESQGEGTGATFTVQLPLLQLPQAPEPKPSSSNRSIESNPSPVIQARLAGVQVLVVDDEADNLELVTFILKQAGATVTAAISAAEGLNQFQQVKPDILLTDIGMPEMDGYSLLQRIRQMPVEQGGQVPAIALTAYASKLDQQQALRAGFQRHLAKPVTPEELVGAIDHVMQTSPIPHSPA